MKEQDTKNTKEKQDFSTRGMTLEKKKEAMHKLIDNITEADYVEAESKIRNISGDRTQIIHQIFIEKEGNVIIYDKEDRKYQGFPKD